VQRSDEVRKIQSHEDAIKLIRIIVLLVIMEQVSKPTWNKVNKLSEQELDKLADIMDVGFLNDDLDRDEKVLVLTTESESKILKALKQLKASE
jgi:hypothetical protein